MTDFFYRLFPGIFVRYVTKIFLKYFLIIISFFFSLIFLLNYLELYRKITKESSVNLFEHFQIALQKTPIILLQASALIVCFSAIGAILQLSRNSELIAAKAAGFSLRRMFFIFGNIGLFLGFISVFIVQPVATELFTDYRVWEKNEDSKNAIPVRTVFRSNGKSVFVITEILNSDTKNLMEKQETFIPLGETEIHFLNERDLDEKTIFSKTARLKNLELTLINPNRYQNREIKTDGKDYTLILPSADIFTEPEKRIGELMTVYDFPKEISKRENNDIPADLFKTRYYDWLSLPFLFFLSAASAVVFSPKSPRRGKPALYAALAVAFGAFAYGANAFGLSLANAGVIAPLTGAIFPKITLFFILFFILMQREYGR